jgi:hypothetical protein
LLSAIFKLTKGNFPLKQVSISITLLFVLTFSGCGATDSNSVRYEIPVRNINITATPESGEFAFNGKGIIFVNAYVTPNINGSPITCTTQVPITLWKATTYSEERVSYLYENKGDRLIQNFKSLPTGVLYMDPEVKFIDALAIKSYEAKCNSSGTATFRNLPEGDYFVSSFIQWEQRTRSRFQLSNRRGIRIAKKVKISERSSNVDVVLWY